MTRQQHVSGWKRPRFVEIIRRCTGEFTLVTSEAVREELSHIPDSKKRLRVEKILSVAGVYILIDQEIITRMHEFIRKGGYAMDSLHVACAEHAGATFLTTDDGLITFFKSRPITQIDIENPVTWLKEGSA